MRIKNYIDGKRYMTEQNAIRHYLSKARKLDRVGTYEEKNKLLYEIYGEYSLDISPCDKCSCDDFGLCGLRHRTELSKQDKFNKFCFKELIKQLEEMEIKPYKNVRKTPNEEDKTCSYKGNINEYYKKAKIV